MRRTERSPLIALLVASLLLLGACGSGGDGASSDGTASTISLTEVPEDSPTTTDTGGSGDDTPETTTKTSDEAVELSGSYGDMAKHADDDTYSFALDADDPDKALATQSRGSTKA